jgi:hypothetical protein
LWRAVSAEEHVAAPLLEGVRSARIVGPRSSIRKVARPPHARLIREIHALGWSAVGRRYGVSDNSVRK